VKRLFHILAVTLSVAVSGPSLAGDPIVWFDLDDVEMNRAMQNATESLPLFFKSLEDENGRFDPDGSVKVSFTVDTPDSTDEIIWVTALRRTGNGLFTGRLDNEPNYMPGLTEGSPVDFRTGQIRDWGYLGADQKLYGNYTTRVLIDRFPTDQNAWILSLLSRRAVPADWLPLPTE
jgi:uncharacterized protein YegJ (DUF2314 family)